LGSSSFGHYFVGESGISCTLDDRSVDLVNGMAQGMMNNEVAKALNISAPRVCQIKRKIAGQIKEKGEITLSSKSNTAYAGLDIDDKVFPLLFIWRQSYV